MPAVQRDKNLTRHVRRLFWHASTTNPSSLVLWLVAKPAATVLFHVLIPLQIAYGIGAIIRRDFAAIPTYAWTIFILAVGYCILWWIASVAIAKNVKYGTNYIQEEALSNYLGKDYDFFTNSHIGSLSTQIARVQTGFNNFASLLNQNVTTQITVVISSVAVIAWQSWVLAAVTLLAMLLILSFTLASMKWRIKYRHLLDEATTESFAALGDTLSHAQTVKSFATEEYEKRRLTPFFHKLSHVQYRSWVASTPPELGRQLLAAVCTLVLLIFTARLYEQESISIAVVLLVQLYVVKLISATGEIAESIKQYDDVMTISYAAVKTMLIPPTVTDAKDCVTVEESLQANVSFSNVDYRYDDSDQFALQQFTLHMAPGERVGLIGYSGSGKTTVTKLLLRFMDVNDGSISVGGQDIREVPQQALRNRISYVPQEPMLFHRSIAENIAYGKPDATPEEIRRAGRAAYVDEFVTGLRDGYETVVGERGVRLSGGQRQRVALARAILKDAPILVLDEATSALDSQSEQYIQKALWKLMERRTALVIAHRLSTIKHMDRIVVMDQGRIVEIGTHDELLSRENGVYAKLWAHQSSATEFELATPH